MRLKRFMLLVNYRVSFKSSLRRCSIETLTHVFSREFCEIFKNTFTEHLWTTTSVAYVSNAKKNLNTVSYLCSCGNDMKTMRKVYSRDAAHPLRITQ